MDKLYTKVKATVRQHQSYFVVEKREFLDMIAKGDPTIIQKKRNHRAGKADT